MTEDAESTLPKLGQGTADPAKDEGRPVNATIQETFESLASEMRDRAGKAKGKLDGATKADERAVLLPRFELCADAATDRGGRRLHREECSE